MTYGEAWSMFRRCRAAKRGNDGVEGYVVFADKLEKLDLIRIPPPLLPIGGMGRGDRNISDTGIKPHVENFVLVSFLWYGYPPF